VLVGVLTSASSVPGFSFGPRFFLYGNAVPGNPILRGTGGGPWAVLATRTPFEFARRPPKPLLLPRFGCCQRTGGPPAYTADFSPRALPWTFDGSLFKF